MSPKPRSAGSGIARLLAHTGLVLPSGLPAKAASTKTPIGPGGITQDTPVLMPTKIGVFVQPTTIMGAVVLITFPDEPYPAVALPAEGALAFAEKVKHEAEAAIRANAEAKTLPNDSKAADAVQAKMQPKKKADPDVDPDYGGVLGADGQVHSDADPGM